MKLFPLPPPSPRLLILPVLLLAALAGCQTTQSLGGPPGPGGSDAGAPTDGAPLGLRAFLTSASYKGDLVGAAGGGLDGHAAGDALCGASAKGAGLTGTWIAYLSSGADAAAAHVVDDGPFYAVDGKTRLYDSKLGVGNRALVEIPDEHGQPTSDVFASTDKFGNTTGGSTVASFWTGSSAAGQVDKTCQSWTSTNLFDDGNHASQFGASTTILGCDQEHHLLCLEQKEAHAGRPTKKVFITRNAFTGDLATGYSSGLAGADARCAAAAADGGLKGTFVAWLSGQDKGALVRASDRITEARYVLLDGKLAFDSKAQLTAGPTNPIMVSELGVELPPGTYGVWTGTLSSGTPSPDFRCLDWTSASRADEGALGDASLGGALWSGARSPVATFCSSPQNLYCFEQ